MQAEIALPAGCCYLPDLLLLPELVNAFVVLNTEPGEPVFPQLVLAPLPGNYRESRSAFD